MKRFWTAHIDHEQHIHDHHHHEQYLYEDHDHHQGNVCQCNGPPPDTACVGAEECQVKLADQIPLIELCMVGNFDYLRTTTVLGGPVLSWSSRTGSARILVRSVCKTPIAVTDPTAVTTWSAQASIKVLVISDVFIHKAIRNLTIFSSHLFF